MTQHIIRGYKPYSPVELAAAAERHRLDGTPKPVALMEKEPLMMTVINVVNFNRQRAMDRRRLKDKFGAAYSKIFVERAISYTASHYPEQKRKTPGAWRS